jgi:hypothetical protein
LNLVIVVIAAHLSPRSFSSPASSSFALLSGYQQLATSAVGGDNPKRAHAN